MTTTSLSCIYVVGRGEYNAAGLREISSCLGALAASSEIILVANGLADQDYLALKDLVAELPDCTCLVIGEPVDTDVAQLLGLENAIGDFIVVANTCSGLVQVLPAMLHDLRMGYDVVRATFCCVSDQPARANLITRLGHAAFKSITGVEVPVDPWPALALSRDAALHILSRPDSQLRLRSGSAGSGFPATTLEGAIPCPGDRHRRPLPQKVRRGVRLLVSLGAVPVRAVNLVMLAASSSAVLYAIYVAAVYMFKSGVEPGWTSLSLEMSGLMFLLSVGLALISEYIVQIYVANAGRRTRLAIRELHSQRTASTALNVVGADGRFQLGAPDAYPSQGHSAKAGS